MRQAADRARGKGWPWALKLGLPLLSLILYLAAVWLRSGGPGYPIDDAWIHQSYARSLAERGEMSFHPGEPSAGSTSPLWSLLLAPGHWIGQPLAWSYALGLFSMILCAWLTGWLSAWLFPGQRWLPPLATAATVLEWQMSWATASGMETTLFIAGTLALMERGQHSGPASEDCSVAGTLNAPTDGSGCAGRWRDQLSWRASRDRPGRFGHPAGQRSASCWPEPGPLFCRPRASSTPFSTMIVNTSGRTRHP